MVIFYLRELGTKLIPNGILNETGDITSKLRKHDESENLGTEMVLLLVLLILYLVKNIWGSRRSIEKG